MKQKLTVKLCRDLKPGTARYTVSDTDPRARGLGLRVSPGGLKVFILQYRMGRRVAKVTLGELGSELTLDQARARVAAHWKTIAQGKDPAAERRAELGAPTVRELWTEFLATLEGKRAASTLREYKMILKKYIGPEFGSRTPAEVSWSEVARLHRRIGKRAPVQANRMLKTGARVFDYAARLELPGMADRRNAFRQHDRHPETATAGRAFTRDELAALGAALPSDPGDVAGMAVRLIALSGMRHGEVVSLRWSAVSEDLRLVRLPAAKTGPRVVYLGAPAAELIGRLPRVAPWLFPSSKGRKGRKGRKGPIVSARYAWEAARAAAEVSGRLHDLRHTFGTVAEEVLGIPRERVMALMGHSRGAGGVHARYVHRADLRLLADADRVAGWIAGALAGEVAAGEVVAFPTG